jgi:hypothetical protein
LAELTSLERVEGTREVVPPILSARLLFTHAGRVASARTSPLGELRIWLTGAEIDEAWRAVHAAEEQMVLALPDAAVSAQVPELAAGVRTQLPANDERASGYLQTLAAISTTGHVDREQLKAIRATLNDLRDESFANVRGFRNVALGAVVALTAVAIALVFDAPGDEWLPICAPKAKECATVGQIEIVGALGGLLGVVAALYSFQGGSGPYALPAVLAVLKVPAGALTGLLGAMWMQSEQFGLKSHPGSSVLAYVALFGFAQQAITTFADRQAGQILGPVQKT